MTELLDMLAQTSGPTTQPAPGGLAGILQSPLVPLVLVIGVFWWMMSRGRRKEQRKFQDMLSSLQRNDRVLTIGGVIGTVVDVRDDEVVLKVDETSNTKMRFSRSAIKGLMQDTTIEQK